MKKMAILLVAAVALAADAPKDEASKKDMEKLKGTWTITSAEVDGQKVPVAELTGNKVVLDIGKFTAKEDDKPLYSGTFKVDATTKPKSIDAIETEGDYKGKVVLGIYEINGDNLKVCFSIPGSKDRPKDFTSVDGILFIVKRDTPVVQPQVSASDQKAKSAPQEKSQKQYEFPVNGAEPAADGKRKVVVSGSATVFANADMARIAFAITTSDANVKKARDENNQQVKKVEDSLAALEFKNMEIRVVPSAMDPTISPEQAKQVQSTLHVTVREKDRGKLRQMAIRVADVAVENGGTAPKDDRFPTFPGSPQTLQGPRIEWSSEDTRESRREAIKKAVDEARANAQAAVGDAKIKVVEIVVSTDPLLKPGMIGPYGVTSSSSTTAGRIPVTVDVKVTCSY